MKIKKKSKVGWITKDGGELGWTDEGGLYINGAGIWKDKMGKTDKKVKITIEQLPQLKGM